MAFCLIVCLFARVALVFAGQDSNQHDVPNFSQGNETSLLHARAQASKSVLCKDSDKNCIDRAFDGDCKSDPDFMLKNCELSCGVCSNIWCQSGIYCTSDSAAHSTKIEIRYSEAKCHGYCFPKSCAKTWEACTRDNKMDASTTVCSEPTQVGCVVPLEHAPISDHEASEALDKLLKDLGDEPDKMNLVDKHRKTILDYITRGIGPDDVPKKILPDMGTLTADASKDVASLSSTSGCIQQIAAVSVDSVFLVASITRLGSLIQRNRLSEGLGRRIQEVEMTAYSKLGADSKGANAVFKLSSQGASAWAKAGATFSIFASTASMLSIGQIMKQIKLSLQGVSWWRWLWMGVQVGAQLAAWFLTDGFAFIAQAVGIISQVTHLVSDAVSLAGALKLGCGGSSRRRRSTTRPPRSTTTTTTGCPSYKYDYQCENKKLHGGECGSLLAGSAVLLQGRSAREGSNLLQIASNGHHIFSGKAYNRIVLLKIYFDGPDKRPAKCSGVSNGGLFVLTASHCLQRVVDIERTAEEFTVYATAQLGKSSATASESEAVRVEWASVYPIAVGVRTPDIAVVKLRGRIPGMSRISPKVCINYRKPVPKDPENPSCGDKFNFGGFGPPKQDGPADYILKGAVFNVHGNAGHLTTMSSDLGYGIYVGDSGGPFYKEESNVLSTYLHVFGINSLGSLNDEVAARMVNMNALKDSDWVKKYVKPNFVSCCEARYATCLP